jgi:hypothetical protein
VTIPILFQAPACGGGGWDEVPVATSAVGEGSAVGGV